MAERMIGVLARLGSEYAFVLYGEDGLDEFTTTAPTFIYRLRNGEVTTAEFTPEDLGIVRARPDDLLGGEVDENVAITRAILAGEAGPKRDAAIVNAAPALVVAGLAQGFIDGIELANSALDSGDAAAVLDRAVALSSSF
jgi:anthranilate phosphoribosyltransferase